MAFLVVLRRTGPQWDVSRTMEEQSGWPQHAAFMDRLVDHGVVVLGGPLADSERVVLAVEADSEESVRKTLGGDPWSRSHLVIDAVEPWTIRLDARRGSGRLDPLRVSVPLVRVRERVGH